MIPDWTIVVQFGIFVFSLLVLNLVLFKPVLKTLEERDSRTRGNEDEAEALTKKTEIKVHSYERRMTAARQRASEERRKVAKEGADRERELLDAARSRAAKALDEAAAKVAEEKAAASRELTGQVQALAVEIASKVAGRPLSAGGQG